MRRRRAKLTDDEIAEAKRLDALGWYQHQIAKHLGIGQSSICRALKSPKRTGAHPIAPNRGSSSRRPMNLPHPCGSDEPYSDDEREYLTAVRIWQERSGTRFPTACEYRQVLLSLGYRKAPA